MTVSFEYRANKGAKWIAAFCATLAFIACGGENKPASDSNGSPTVSYGEEEANVDVWLETMEVGSRELYNARGGVLEAVDAKPGQHIADIGAGTGLYTLLFADKVGPSGVVYAVDIEPRFLTLINQRAADNDLDNVVSVLSREDSITLPPQSLDMVFISDTYNYFEDPKSVMETVYRALRPGGTLVVVDFDLKDTGERDASLRHIRVGKEAVVNEIETIGFDFLGEQNVLGLQETYMMKFSRP